MTILFRNFSRDIKMHIKVNGNILRLSAMFVLQANVFKTLFLLILKNINDQIYSLSFYIHITTILRNLRVYTRCKQVLDD